MAGSSSAKRSVKLEHFMRGLFYTTDKIVTGITNNLTFLRHHGMPALGTGVKEGFHLIDRCGIF
jgi:hypothetical protein